MTYTNHVRINELARELEVKTKVIIHLLPCFGVAEKKTRSSSIPVDIAEKIRAAKSLFHGRAAPAVPSATPPEHIAAPAPAAPKPAPAPGVIENLVGVQRSSEKQPRQPTYEELLAHLRRLEAQRSAQARIGGSTKGRGGKRKKKEKRRAKRSLKPFRTISGGLPSLGKR
jgi:hypothetical protein